MVGSERGRCSPEAETFFSQPMPKTVFWHIVLESCIYSLTVIHVTPIIPKTDPRFKKKWVGSDYELYVHTITMSN